MSYGATIPNALGDGRGCSVADADCELRPCLWVREDQGTYAQGRGYRYDGPAKRRLLCGTREARGCPHPVPAPDPEKVRCCRAPTFHRPRGRPSFQTCLTCGKRSSGRRLELVRELPKAPAVRCAHAMAEEVDWQGSGGGKAWRCSRSLRGCGAYWDRKPAPHEPGEEVAAFGQRRFDAWMASIRTTEGA